MRAGRRRRAVAVAGEGGGRGGRGRDFSLRDSPTIDREEFRDLPARDLPASCLPGLEGRERKWPLRGGQGQGQGQGAGEGQKSWQDAAADAEETADARRWMRSRRRKPLSSDDFREAAIGRQKIRLRASSLPIGAFCLR